LSQESNQSAPLEETVAVAVVDPFTVYFENNAGNASVQAIQVLSAEAQLQVASHKTLSPRYQQLDSVFTSLDVDNLVDSIDTLNEPLLDTLLVQQMHLVNQLDVPAQHFIEQLAHISSSFQQDVSLLQGKSHIYSQENPLQILYLPNPSIPCIFTLLPT
jgi:HPt (histidine-containing phosphotransfer) domain-containing protein